MNDLHVLEWIQAGSDMAKTDHAAGQLAGVERLYTQREAEDRGYEVPALRGEDAPIKPDAVFWRAAMAHTGSGELEERARSFTALGYRTFALGVLAEEGNRDLTRAERHARGEARILVRARAAAGALFPARGRG